jgi:hypothetical protein
MANQPKRFKAMLERGTFGRLSGTEDFRGQVAQPPSEMQFSSQSNDERT